MSLPKWIHVSTRVALFAVVLSSLNVAAVNSPAQAAGTTTNTVTFTALPAAAVGATATLSATASTSPITFSSSTSTVCSVSENKNTTLIYLAVGTCTVVATAPSDAIYAIGTATQSVTVAKGTNTISFTAPQGVVGRTDVLTPTAATPVSIVRDDASSSICTLSGSSLTYNAAGTCTIRLNAPADDNYLVANEVVSNITVAVAVPSSLGIVRPSADAVSGSVFGTTPQVSILDQFGNIIESSTASISVAITAPGTFAAGVQTTYAAVGGVASFNGLRIDAVGGPYTLTYSSGNLTSISETVVVSAAGASCVVDSTTANGYTYVAFKKTDQPGCTWNVPAGASSVDYLIVGGGGGGGSRHASGGGAGGLVTGTLSTAGVAKLEVNVGSGGRGGGGGPTVSATAGLNSVVRLQTATDYTLQNFTAFGGGAGDVTTAGFFGSTGGTRGGASAAATSPQGNKGGTGGAWYKDNYGGGGGGGAGAVGGSGTISTTKGGIGKTVSFIDDTVGSALQVGQSQNGRRYFAGGGGAGWATPTPYSGLGAAGGVGGGGQGGAAQRGAPLDRGTDGTANTGGGGGGSGLTDGGVGYPLGGAGGSGVVVLRFSTLASRILTITQFNNTYLMNQVPPTILAVPSAGAGVITYASESIDVCTIDSSTGKVTFQKIGMCQLSAAITDDTVGGFAPASTSIQFALTLGEQRIAWEPNTQLVVGSSPETLSATSNGGGAITFSVVDAGTTGCSISGTTLTYSAVGTCEVRAQAAATTTYEATSRIIAFTMTSSVICDMEFTALSFDMTKSKKIKGDGRAVGDKILYSGVASYCGGLEALVTTSALVDATIVTYDVHPTVTDAFTLNSQVTSPNGFAEFKFEFFQSGTYETASPVQVTMRNLTHEQTPLNRDVWYEFPNAESYTWENTARYFIPAEPTTYYTETPISDIRFRVTTCVGTATTKCKVRLQYGETKSITIRMGSAIKGNPAHMVGFVYSEAGRTPLLSVGSTRPVVFDANGATGTALVSSMNIIGTTVTPNLKPALTKVGYLFDHWNSRRDGTGKRYTRQFAVPHQGITLFAQWRPAPKTLTYNTAMGTGTFNPERRIPETSAALSANIPVRTGFTFGGWNTSATGAGTSYSASASFTMPTADTTLYAQWSNSISLRYDLAGGVASTLTAASLTSGTTTNVTTTVPTRDGYFFAGWDVIFGAPSARLSGGQSLKVGTTDIILAAAWVSNTYELAYNANGGSAEPAPLDNAASTVTLSAQVPVRPGYTFNGWSTNSAGTGTIYPVSGSFTFADSNKVVLYATWTVNSYTLTYDANGGSGAPNSATVDAFASHQVSAVAPTRAGYTFREWNVSADGSGQNAQAGWAFSMPAGNVTLYAQWSADITYLRFWDNGGAGSPVNATTFVGGSETLSSVRPTRPGYTFTSWNTRADGQGSQYSPGAVITGIPSAGVDLYAQWAANTFTITYFPNGGTATVPLTATAVGGTSVTLIDSSKMVRTGFEFDGWADQTQPGIVLSSRIVEMPFNDISLIARWKPISFTLTYNVNGGVAETFETATVDALNAATVTYIAPARTGYIFGGWNTAENGNGTFYEAGSKISLTANTILYAIWYAKPEPPATKVLSYSAEGGSGAPSSVSAGVGTVVTLSTTKPTRDGYTFTGWSATPTGSSILTITISADTLVYALWEANKYKISYNPNGGIGSVLSGLISYGDSTTLSATVPTRSDYTFAGWNTSPNGGGVMYQTGQTLTMPANDLFLYAMWNPVIANKYSVIYSANGGANAPEVVEATDGSTVTLTTSGPTRAGYTFAGWSETVNGSAATSVTVSSANITVYARWTANVNSVRYNANGGTGAPSASSAATDAVFTVSTSIPTRTGYVFSGWNTTVGGSGSDYAPGSTFTMPSANVALYAQWVQQGVTLIYNANGGTGTGSLAQTVNMGATPTLPTASSTDPSFARSGFTLNAWNNASTGTGSSYALGSSSFVMPAQDTVLYATWQGTNRQLTYASTVTAQGLPSAVTATAGAPLTISGVKPTLTGKKFVGWNTAEDGSGVTYGAFDSFYMPDAATTLYAVWANVAKTEQTVTFRKIDDRVLAQSPIALDAGSNSGAVLTYESNSPSVCSVDSAGVVTLIGLGECSIAITAPGNNEFEDKVQTISFNVVRYSERPAPSNPSVLNPQVGDVTTQNGKAETKIDGVSDKATYKLVTPTRGIKDVEFTNGKVIITSEPTFSGKTNIVVVVSDAGQDKEITIPVTVNPSPASGVKHTPVGDRRTSITWNKVLNATSYEVRVNGVVVCRTVTTTCAVPSLLGPAAKITIVSLGGDNTSSASVASAYANTKPIPALNVYFGVSKATLTAAERAKVIKFANTVKAQGFTRIILEGHTDAQGGSKNSTKLSNQRTNAVAALLSRYVKVSITKRAAGEKKPVASNATAAGQAKNRRVEAFVR